MTSATGTRGIHANKLTTRVDIGRESEREREIGRGREREAFNTCYLIKQPLKQQFPLLDSNKTT